MFELQFIFILTFATIYILSRFGVSINRNELKFKDEFHWNFFYFLSFIILALFIGTRDGVGRDFYSYKESYNMGQQLFKFGESDEIGYIWLINILHFFNFNYHSFFLVTSFITVWLLFNCFKNEYQILPLGILIFCIGGVYMFIINGVRQGIAIMAFINALSTIRWDVGEKYKFSNFFWVSFYLIIGALFHYTIILLFIIVFILNKKVLSFFNPLILIIIVISGFFINSVSSLNIISSSLIEIFPKYASYADPESNIIQTGTFGIGAFIFLLTNLLPLIFYKKIKNEYPSSSKYFVLFTIGTGLYYAFSKYMLINRALMYLTYCNIFVFAYAFSYFKSKIKTNLIYLFLNIFILFGFVIYFFSPLSEVIEIQILQNNFSLWFIPLTKW